MANRISTDRKQVFQKIMWYSHKLGKLKCAYCEVGFTYECEWTTPTLDHIMPVSKGGSSHLSNLVPCCKKCNHTKQDSTSWKVKYQNYGFGLYGVAKKNFPLAWQHTDDIIKTQRIRLLKKVVKDFFKGLFA